MKRFLALCALFPIAALAAAVATVTPGDWPLYRGTSIVARYATEAACIDAAKALGVARAYTCRTSTGVAVSIVPDAPVATLTVSPTSLVGLGTVTINYACSAGAATLSALGQSQVMPTPSGSISAPISATATIGLSCSGGGSASATVTVTAAPPVDPPPPPPPPVDPPPSGGRVLNVTPNGSASSDCIASACSLNRAHAVVKPGDTILAQPGTYGELQVRNWGTATGWITLKGAGPGVVIRGTGIGPSVYLYDSRCDEYAPAGSVCPSAFWRFENLTIQGSKSGQGDGNAIKVDLSDVQLVNNKLCCSYADIVKAVRTASRVTITGNEFYQDATVTPISANAQGVDKTGGDDLKVIGNYFHDLPNVAAYAKGNACRPVIEDNLVVNVGGPDAQHAFMLGQQTDANRLVKGCGDTTKTTFESLDGIARNNIIINATGGCFGVSSSHNARVTGNKCINVGTSGRAALYATNESDAPGRQPSDYVEFSGNIIQNTTGKMFSDSDALSLNPWSGLVMKGNVYFATQPLTFTLKNTNLYGGGTWAQWQVTYKSLTGNTDDSTTGNPNLDAAALISQWRAAHGL